MTKLNTLRLISIAAALPICTGFSLVACGTSDSGQGSQGMGGSRAVGGGGAPVGQGGSTGGGTTSPGSGGQSGSGNLSQGGAPAAGGAQATSGGTSTAGRASNAGGASVGGGSSAAGSTSSGGAPSAAGTTSSGGLSAAGGTASSGASANSGGTTSTAGTTNGGGLSATGGTASSGGAKSSGGSGNVPKSCVGWASVAGEGLNGTIGGAGGPVIEITSGEQLASYTKNHDPMVFRIMNDITGEIKLGSNKTVEGANKNVTINGGLVFSGKDGLFSNLIVRNLRINGLKSTEDGIDIRQAHHVCIEHCEIFDSPDGNLDIVNQGDYITIAYTKFYYTPAYKPLPDEPSLNHRYSNLIGNSDSATDDAGKLKVTFHHNWWGDLVVERMPRVRFGDVHVFNNYFSAAGSNYCVGAGFQSKLVIENNFFEGVSNPHIFYEGEPTAQIVATGNEYVNVTGLKDVGQGSAFVPPYPYELEPASTVKATVMASTGPR